MLQQYTRSQLETFKRPRLWEICSQWGLPKHAASVKCVEVILANQPVLIAEVVAKAPLENFPEGSEQLKTCATCPLFKPFNDGTGRGLCCGIPDTSLVVRNHHQQTQDCLHLIEESSLEQPVFEEPEFVPIISVCPGDIIAAPTDINHEQAVKVIAVYEDCLKVELQNGAIFRLKFIENSQVILVKKFEFDWSQWKIDESERVKKFGKQQVQAQIPESQDEELAQLRIDEALRSPRAKEIEVLERRGNCFVVRNTGNNNHYVVRPNHPNLRDRCECGDAHYRGVKCKHQIAVTQFKQATTVAVRSGRLTFKSLPNQTYQVFNGLFAIGLICLRENGRWTTSVSGSGDYGTPYEAAAALEEYRSGIADNVQDLLDKAVDELTAVEWESVKQEYSAEIEEKIEEMLDVVEVDGKPDANFGQLYRVWHKAKLLGTFYQTVFTNKWVARPSVGREVFLDCKDEEDAKYWIAYSCVS